MFDFPNVPFIGQKVTGAGGIEYLWDGVKWTASVTGSAYAPINNPVFTGDPQAPTPATSDSDTTLATTAFVKNVIAAAPPPGAIISATAPTGQNPGAMWWDTNGGQLYILYNDGNSTQWVSANNIGLSNVATQADVGKNTGRNLLHNSMFNVQQRGIGPWNVGNQYTADRWFIAKGGSDAASIALNATIDADRAAIGDEAVKTVLANVFTGSSAAGSYNFLIQFIEDARRLAGKTVTISFWAASSVGQKIGVGWSQNFGSGGSPSASVSGAGQAVTITASVWRRYSVTLTIQSASGKVFGTDNNSNTEIDFWFSDQGTFASRSGGIGVQSGTIVLWGVQLEIGSTTTPLEKPDPQVELANCQRFYQTGTAANYTYDAGGNGFGYRHSLPVNMRTNPTITFVGPTYINASALAAISVLGGSFLASALCGTTGGCAFEGPFTASADL